MFEFYGSRGCCFVIVKHALDRTPIQKVYGSNFSILSTRVRNAIVGGSGDVEGAPGYKPGSASWALPPAPSKVL